MKKNIIIKNCKIFNLDIYNSAELGKYRIEKKNSEKKTSVFSQISKHDYDYELPSSQPEVSQEFENDYVGKRIQKSY